MPRNKPRPQDRGCASATSAVLEFMLAHGGSVVTARAVADSLGLDRKVTATLMSRLAHEGRLVRLDRGRYSTSKGVRAIPTGRPARPQQLVLSSGKALWDKVFNEISDEVIRVLGPTSGKRLVSSTDGQDVRERTERLVEALVRELGGRLALDLVQPIYGEVFGDNGRAAAMRLCIPRGGA
jgi:hypothetical protein